MNNPLVSIVVPVYNSGVFLKDCLESLINQSIPDIEIILIDDGSTDESGAICDWYASTDIRVKVIHQDNQGVAKARNTGILYANAEWLMFVDSDDLIERDTIEMMSKYLKREYDVISFSLTKKKDNLHKIDKVKGISLPIEKYKKYLFGACMLNPNDYNTLFPKEINRGPKLVYPVVKLYKTKFLVDNTIFFPERLALGEDQLFNLRVINHANCIFFIDFPLYYYRIHSDSACFNIKGMAEKYSNYLDCIQTERNRYDIATEIDIYLDYRKCDIVKSLIIVSAFNINNFKQFFVRLNELKKFIKEEKIFDSAKAVRTCEYRFWKDKIIIACLKAHVVSIALCIYKCYFLLKKFME